MIRADTDELEMMVSIALRAAPAYALRTVISPQGKMDRDGAIETLTARVIKALGMYELTRAPMPHEEAVGTLPLFPELTRDRP